MARVDAHSVRLHGILNFVDNGLSSSFDPEDLSGLDDVIGGCELSNDT